MTADDDLRRALDRELNDWQGPDSIARLRAMMEPCGWDTRRGDGPIGGPCVLSPGHDGPHAARSEPRAEGQTRDQAYIQGFTDGVAATRTPPTPPAEGLDVERLARAYAEAGYGGVLSDEEWQDIAREYAALAPEQPE